MAHNHTHVIGVPLHIPSPTPAPVPSPPSPAPTPAPVSSPVSDLPLFYALIFSFLLMTPLMLYIARPSFPNPELQINSAVVYNSQLKTHWNFSITLKARKSLMCQDTRASVLRNKVIVASAAVGNSSIEMEYYRNEPYQKKFQANLVSSGVSINESVVEAERIRDGTLTLSLKLSFLGTMNDVGLLFMKESEKVRDVVVLCDDFKLVFIENSGAAVSVGGPFVCNNNVRLITIK